MPLLRDYSYERLIQVMHGLAINYKLPGVLSVY